MTPSLYQLTSEKLSGACILPLLVTPKCWTLDTTFIFGMESSSGYSIAEARLGTAPAAKAVFVATASPDSSMFDQDKSRLIVNVATNTATMINVIPCVVLFFI